MSARKNILNRLRQNHPASALLPSLPTTRQLKTDTVDAFVALLNQLQITTFHTTQENLASLLPSIVIHAKRVGISGMVPGKMPFSTIDANTPLTALSKLEAFICTGALGVAENGAIWLPESSMGHRVAPFISEHLVVVLEASKIVGDLHQTYQQIEMDRDGFGVFIAGPSKTADIEQSLVIGAHGAKKMTVVVVG